MTNEQTRGLSSSASALRWASRALIEGRYLGGRPPYGYTLKDLGTHPRPLGSHLTS
jgi:hypothetical protein